LSWDGLSWAELGYDVVKPCAEPPALQLHLSLMLSCLWMASSSVVDRDVMSRSALSQQGPWMGKGTQNLQSIDR
jgi:hypothetical protein